MDSDSGETQAGTVMGTPSYMAPEQASGQAHEAGPTADVYALGAILYACLTGRPPFKGRTIVETLDQVRTQEPKPPSRWQARVPLDLDTICLKCLWKEPENRYSSAAELADELGRYLRGEAIQARPVGTWERTGKWVKRHPTAAGLLAVSALAILALIGVAVGSVYSVRLTAAYQETESARQLAEEAQTAEAEQRQRAEQFLYFSRVSLAEREWSANNVGQALRLLDECPLTLRGWEMAIHEASMPRRPSHHPGPHGAGCKPWPGAPTDNASPAGATTGRSRSGTH